ncbi:MAG: amidohydrolase family protein [Clostridiaceae bacterium]|nr:amidohydrolase family protein [Clostridiaceae bacterium]
MQKIIDFHTHAFPEAVAAKAVANIGNHYSIPMPGTGNIEDLIKNAEEAKITYLVLHSTATRPAQVQNINNWVAEHLGGRIIGFGTLHPDMDGIEKEFERIISLGLKGIKLHPDFQGFKADDPKLDRIYSLIENRLPLLIHAGDANQDNSSPERIARILDRFPKLTLIAAHLGGHMQWREAMEFLIGKNLYLDTSSALDYMDIEFATQIIKTHGTKKIVFGTDYPAALHRNEFKRFMDLKLTNEERQDILYNNAAKILNIKDHHKSI